MEKVKHSVIIELSQAYFLCVFKLLSEVNIIENTVEIQPRKHSEEYIQALVLKSYEKFLNRAVKVFDEFLGRKEVEAFVEAVEWVKHFEKVAGALAEGPGRDVVEGLLNGEVLVSCINDALLRKIEKIKVKTQLEMGENERLKHLYSESERRRLNLEATIKSNILKLHFS